MDQHFEGPVVWRDDPTHEQTCRDLLWNALTPSRRPEAIVRVASDADVAAAVRLAADRDLQVAVRSGGHSWIGSPLRDGTVLIDLGARRAVQVDEASSTATVEPAVTSAELANTLAERGLAFPVGHCGTVGVGGYLLSGGLGWNSGAWGPACASVTAVDVVTADGDLVRASEDENVDIFWAARGAGPGFPGVVTRFHLALQPLPRAITTATQVYDLAALDDLAPWASEVAAALPVEVEMTLMLTEAGPDLPGEQERKVVVLTATAFVDTPDEVAGELAGLRTPPIPRLAEREEPSPYDVLFHDFGGRWREGSRFASDNVWTDGDLTDALLPLRTSLLEAPSPSSFAFAVMAPDPPEDEAEEELPDMAFSMYARTFVACYAMWDDAEDDAANLEWLPTAMAALEPGSAGHYVAEADLTAAAPRTARSYAAPAWDRLQDLQRRLDPDGRFPGYLGPEDRGTAAP